MMGTPERGSRRVAADGRELQPGPVVTLRGAHGGGSPRAPLTESLGYEDAPLLGTVCTQTVCTCCSFHPFHGVSELHGVGHDGGRQRALAAASARRMTACTVDARQVVPPRAVGMPSAVSARAMVVSPSPAA
jgi:hypothetical protein